MESLTVRPCSVAEIEDAPNIDALLAEYAVECALVGLPQPAPHWDTYRRLEQSGAFHVLGAFLGGELVGILTMVVNAMPHYSARIAVSESYFVTAAARRSGAGTALRLAAEGCAQSHGAKALLISAPAGGKLDRVMQFRDDYTLSNCVYLKVLP